MEKAKGDRGGKAAIHSTGTAKWTFMVYMAGDNNLDGAALETRRHKKGLRREALAIGAPAAIRTRGLRIRNPSLYPTELQGHTVQTAIRLTRFTAGVNTCAAAEGIDLVFYF